MKLLLKIFLLIIINVESREVCKEIWKMENNVNGNIIYGVRLNLCTTDNLNLDKVTIDSLAPSMSQSCFIIYLSPSSFHLKI